LSDRDVRNIEKSVLKKEAAASAPAEEKTELCKETGADAKILLFATKTCPKCKIAQAELDKKGIPYEKLLVEENRELAQSYGLKQAPTLIVTGDTTQIYADLPAVKEFIKGYSC